MMGQSHISFLCLVSWKRMFSLKMANAFLSLSNRWPGSRRKALEVLWFGLWIWTTSVVSVERASTRWLMQWGKNWKDIQWNWNMMDHMRELLGVELTLLKIVSNVQSYPFSGKQLSKTLYCSLQLCNKSRNNCKSEVWEEIMIPAFLKMLQSVLQG